MELLQEIFNSSQSLLNIYKLQSRFHLLDNSVNWKKQGSGDKEIKRASSLFSEIQSILISFSCSYFKTFNEVTDKALIEG